MLFVDYCGPAELYTATRAAVQERVAAVFRAPADEVIVRRVVVESEYAGVEVWVELSSEEQLYRYGRRLASEVSAAIRETHAVDVWVMFRIVPLEHAFLNGSPRRRATASLD
jgi:hypothetical protein